MAKGKSKGRTQNPKFAKSTPPAQQVGMTGGSGMNVGGLTDVQVRQHTNVSGSMLHKQLKRNKSAGLSTPGR